MPTSEITIDLQPVDSSRFTHIGYHADSFTMAIRFPPSVKEPEGALYYYDNIGEELWDDFVHAKSKGIFFGERILGNPEYPCRRVTESQLATDFTDDGTPVPAIIQSTPTVPEDEEQLKSQAIEVANQVRALSIVSAEEYAIAGNEFVRLREMRKSAQERVDRVKKPAYAAYQATLDLERDVIGPYKQAEEYLDSGMARYRAAEKAARLRKEMEENTRRRQEAEAEAKRKAAELAEQDAKAAEAQGEPEMAAQIRQQPLPLAPIRVQGVVLPKDVPKVNGIVERGTTWKWRKKDGEEHLVPREYLMLNDVAINGVVRGLKGLTNIPGIEVYEVENKSGVRL